MPRKPTPYVKRPPCTACAGRGVRTSYDHARQRHVVTECPTCKGSGKQ